MQYDTPVKKENKIVKTNYLEKQKKNHFLLAENNE